MKVENNVFISQIIVLCFSVPVPPSVPVGCLAMPEELMNQPVFILSDTNKNITQYSIAEIGGHFAAYEVPHIVGKNALQFFASVVQ